MTAETKFRAPTADGRMMYALTKDEAPGWGGKSPFYGLKEWVTAGVDLVSTGGYATESFLIAPVGADAVEFIAASSAIRPTVGYRRAAKIEHLPEYVEVDKWDSFRDSLGWDSDADDHFANNWYRAELAEQVLETRTFDLAGYSDFPVDMLDLESISDPDGSFFWTVSKPYLVFGTDFESALPGVLSKFEERLVKAVEARSEAKIWTHKAKEFVVDGSITLRFEDHRTYPVKNTRGRTTHQSPSTKAFNFTIPFPKTIPAKSKAKAIAKFNKLVDDIVEQIAGKDAVVCAHCSGEGVILT